MTPRHPAVSFRSAIATLGLFALICGALPGDTVFDDPQPANSYAQGDVFNDAGGRIAFDVNGRGVLVWTTDAGPDGGDDVFFATSDDSGVTWSTASILHESMNTDVANLFASSITYDGVGTWIVTMFGARGTPKYDVLASRSTDGGATWSEPVVLNVDAKENPGDDWRPSAAGDGQGNWVVVWDSVDSSGSTHGTDGDIFVVTSNDDGRTWSAPALLNTGAVSDIGTDFTASVHTDKNGNWFTCWTAFSVVGGIELDTDILLASSTDNGATWSTPILVNRNAATDAGNDTLPRLSTDFQGNWLAVWMSNDTLGGTLGTDLDILAARSADNCATWSAPVSVKSNANVDSSTDEYPSIATNQSGEWIAVWHSTDTLNGTIGPDLDILTSTSFDNGATWSNVRAMNAASAANFFQDSQPYIATDTKGQWAIVYSSNDPRNGTLNPGDVDVLCSNNVKLGTVSSPGIAIK